MPRPLFLFALSVLNNKNALAGAPSLGCVRVRVRVREENERVKEQRLPCALVLFSPPCAHIPFLINHLPRSVDGPVVPTAASPATTGRLCSSKPRLFPLFASNTLLAASATRLPSSSSSSRAPRPDAPSCHGRRPCPPSRRRGPSPPRLPAPRLRRRAAAWCLAGRCTCRSRACHSSTPVLPAPSAARTATAAATAAAAAAAAVRAHADVASFAAAHAHLVQQCALCSGSANVCQRPVRSAAAHF